MFGSIYIGMSGLSAYSKGLEAVSNNVSNMNTQGFKASEVTFSDIYGSGSSGGLEYGDNQQGSGHGVTVNELSTNFGQGELRQTDRDLDLAVDGNGFFVLLDGDQQLYTRTGSFVVDDEGFIVLEGTDNRLAILDESGRPVAVNIDEYRSDSPVATSRITFRNNLSSGATEHNVPDIQVHAPDGETHLWTVKLDRPDNLTDIWTVTVSDEDGREIGTQSLEFHSGIVAPGSGELLFEDAENGLSVTFDFTDGVTYHSFGTVSELSAKEIDGKAPGKLANLTVTPEGVFEVTYSNGEKKELGAIALADFRDPQSLEQRGNAIFAETGFGQKQYLGASDERVGSILSRRLEASNVDLGAQFGELILIQRGFQASSQIISVTNDMIQQLFGIRGG